MQFTTLLLVSFAAFAAAAPSSLLEERTGTACPSGLYSVAQCCSVNVLGVASLDCTTPPGGITGGSSPSALKKCCTADGGRVAQCCVLPVAGQGLVCQNAAA